ncbi:MAG TPA: CDP-alcohol phosphatidyltransferase family protein [Candidatus Dormibacteraeota bacterium]|nr:CDP-alcohol phosphatidyltransferase family protein [Candidatus Dormibacteraeota bacterium]
MLRALLYLPDDAALTLAGASVSGRTLTVRALVAALRAGASLIAAPSALRDASVEGALRQMPALAAAVLWLAPETEPPVDAATPWLLLPASTLVHVSTLGGLLASPPPPGGAVLAASTSGPAPVAFVDGALAASIWKDVTLGQAVGLELTRRLQDAERREGGGPYVAVRREADLPRAEEALQSTLGIGADSGVDRYLHRRCSRFLTRMLVRTAVTPNQVSLSSLAIGAVAIWCFWHATTASAFWGILLYAAASIVDHSDGEIARLTFQESRFGANLDWTIDTIIHGGLVLGIGVTAGGPLMLAVGLVAAAGVTLSALFARHLPREIEVGPTVGGVLKNIANRDLFYLLLIGAAVLRWLEPPLVAVAALVVAVGSQVYWVGCVARIRRTRREQAGS